MDTTPVLEGRSCRECSLCCRVLGVDEIEKPPNAACPNCVAAVGCRIYESRPDECRDFYCGYLTLPMVDEKWFPARSGMVVYPAPEGNRLTVHVDRMRPDVWLGEPYYSEIKRWARLVADRDFQVLVCIGKRTIAILPDRDVDLGSVEPEEYVIYGFAIESGRRVRTAAKRKARATPS